ncbi:MAG TPA: hemolysin III family protein [Jatrophihabitantaceae bacterium]|nr:hemolysin III family protein [Jatrophihabitantaceae bacterium]
MGPDASRRARTSGSQLYDSGRDLHYDKPKLRGWLHFVSFVAALVVGTVLVAEQRGAALTTDALVYAGVVAGLFGASALYHRGTWSARNSARLQRVDHVMIILLIAGTATPPMQVCLSGSWRVVALTVLWTLAGAAIAIRLARMHASERLVGAIYIGLGWVAGTGIPAVWVHSGATAGILLLCGGVLYMVGAIGYHRRWPDPCPSYFGYHEVFHTYVTVAAVFQYVAIAFFVL